MKTKIKMVPRVKCSVCRHNRTCTEADIHEDGAFPGCGITLRDPTWRSDRDVKEPRIRKKRTTTPEDDGSDDLMDA